jgi:hypothetical protein
MNFYVYEHRTLDDRLFYVGKGCGYRATSKKGRNPYWHRTVNKYGYYVKIVVKDIDEELAMLAEIELISASRLRGCRLVNLTDGGEGTSGYRYPDELRKEMSIKRTGRPMPEGFGAKVRARQLGVKKSPEVGANISKGKKGKAFSEETKENWKRWNHSEETKEKLRITSSMHRHNDEAKSKISQSKIGKKRVAFHCIHCDRMIAAGNFNRWHGDNCKSNPSNIGEK